jgi:hypothetical protein
VTARLVLRPFTDMEHGPRTHLELNTHPVVVRSSGSSPTRTESDAMISRGGEELARNVRPHVPYRIGALVHSSSTSQVAPSVAP